MPARSSRNVRTVITRESLDLQRREVERLPPFARLAPHAARPTINKHERRPRERVYIGTKTKPTDTVPALRIVGGTSYSSKLDAATICKLRFLVDYYREVVGVRVSSSAIIRRAVEMLTQDADDLIHFSRVSPRAQEIKNEKRLIAFAAAGYETPRWNGGEPPIPTSETSIFPTYKEIEQNARHIEHTPGVHLPDLEENKFE